MSSDTKKKLGERVKRARLEANLKQSELADRLGISQGVISNVETGVSTIDVPELPRWAAALNKPILYFYLDAQVPLREQAEAILSLFPEERLEMVLHLLQQLALSLHTETSSSTSDTP